MITKWKVENFKSIREKADLQITPLTIFVGPNSSGKSSLIQSILLIAQTLSNKVSSRSVVLNGPLAALGQFDDLKSSDSQSDEISIEYTCQPTGDKEVFISGRHYRMHQRRFINLQEISCGVSFNGGESSKKLIKKADIKDNIHQIRPRLSESHVICKFSSPKRRNPLNRELNQFREEVYEIEVSKRKRKMNSIFKNVEENEYPEEELSYIVEIGELFKDIIKRRYKSARAVGCNFQHFLPIEIFFSIDSAEQIAKCLVEALVDPYSAYNLHEIIDVSNKIPPKILTLLRDTLIKSGIEANGRFDNEEGTTYEQFLENMREINRKLRRHVDVSALIRRDGLIYKRIYDALKDDYQNKKNKKILKTIATPEEMSKSFSYLDNFFTRSFKYLGPLRDAPKALYPLTPSNDPEEDIGLKGERTASILDLHKNKEIFYIPPEHFKSPTKLGNEPVRRKLKTAVDDWLKYLNIADSVEIEDKGKFGHEMKIISQKSKASHDPTHVGVGVSQILPILVMGLLAGEDSTLIFEQPELHLHPSVQALLGDFFLSMTMSGKQCIVETHSEYLIDCLRIRIAEQKFEDNANLMDSTTIYFVQNSSRTSSFKKVKINEYGAINDWPEGFFDESVKQAEKVLKASLKKRKSKT